MSMPALQRDQRPGSSSLLASLSQQLAGIEKRDGELWVILVSISLMVAGCLLIVLAPATFLRGGTFHFEISVSKEVFFGFIKNF